LLTDTEAEDVPDVSEDSDDSWMPWGKTPKAEKAGRTGDHCKESRMDAEEEDESSMRNKKQGNENNTSKFIVSNKEMYSLTLCDLKNSCKNDNNLF
jgi:hypothetical protein